MELSFNEATVMIRNPKNQQSILGFAVEVVHVQIRNNNSAGCAHSNCVMAFTSLRLLEEDRSVPLTTQSIPGGRTVRTRPLQKHHWRSWGAPAATCLLRSRSGSLAPSRPDAGLRLWSGPQWAAWWGTPRDQSQVRQKKTVRTVCGFALVSLSSITSSVTAVRWVRVA